MPAISLLIPIYNVEKYLRECLESARLQTFRDIEIICLNDGSTDTSRDIIQEYLDRDTRFKVIDKPNSGYGATMNQGLAAATGDYVAILESDDIFIPTALEQLHTQAQQHDAEVVKADFWLYWSQPTEKSEPFGIIDAEMTGRVVNPQEEHTIFYRKPSIWSALYRRSFLVENDIDFLETPGASYQDAGFNFKVWASATRAAFIDTPILKYRQDNEQSSVNSPGKMFCVCDEYAEMERYLQERPEKLPYLQPVLERMKFDSYMWNYDRLDETLKNDFLKRISKELAQDLANDLVDWSLFEPWAEADFRGIVDTPELFKSTRQRYAKPGKINTFMRYYRLGGAPLVKKVISYKKKKG